MDKIILYTAIFGGKDHLRKVEKFPEIDCVCFTDNKYLKPNGWNVELITPEPEINSRMNAKFYKLFPHLLFPKYKYSIWIDGSIGVRSNPRQLLSDSLKKQDIAVFDHGRNCIYDEAEVCSKYKKDDPEIIKKHMERYRNEGYPVQNGLVSNGIMFRRHNEKKVLETMEFWWNEIKNGSSRDQLSFAYSAWKKELKYNVIPMLIAESPYFIRGIHLRKNSR